MSYEYKTHQASPYFPFLSSGLNLSREKQNRHDMVLEIMLCMVVFHGVLYDQDSTVGVCRLSFLDLASQEKETDLHLCVT